MNEDKMIQEIVDLKTEVKDIRETMVTKDDIREIKDVLEEVVTITKKISVEQDAQTQWLQRLQKNDEKQDKDIAQIKTVLKMA